MRIPLLVCLILLSHLAQSDSFDGQLTIDGKKRTFHYYAPQSLLADRTYPLIIMLHGGGSTGIQMQRLTKFNNLADRDSFMVVYPDGWKKHWNDHRYG